MEALHLVEAERAHPLIFGDGFDALRRRVNVERFGHGPSPDVDELAELDTQVRAWALATDVAGGVA